MHNSSAIFSAAAIVQAVMGSDRRTVARSLVVSVNAHSFLTILRCSTYVLRPKGHEVKIPEAQSTVFTYTAKSVVAVVASPQVHGNVGDPRFVALAASD